MTEAEFHKALGELEHRLGDQLTGVGNELHEVKASVKYVEGRMSSLDLISAKQGELERELNELKVWKATFEGEKSERDKNADNAAAMWRKVAGGLIVALIIGAAGAGFGMYAQYQQNAAIAGQLRTMQVQQGIAPGRAIP